MISNMAVSILKIFNAIIVATLFASLVNIGPVIPEIARARTAPFWTRRQKSAYPIEYLGNYGTRQISTSFLALVNVYVDY